VIDQLWWACEFWSEELLTYAIKFNVSQYDLKQEGKKVGAVDASATGR
jgi:hypothetical protein